MRRARASEDREITKSRDKEDRYQRTAAKRMTGFFAAENLLGAEAAVCPASREITED